MQKLAAGVTLLGNEGAGQIVEDYGPNWPSLKKGNASLSSHFLDPVSDNVSAGPTCWKTIKICKNGKVSVRSMLDKTVSCGMRNSFV